MVSRCRTHKSAILLTSLGLTFSVVYMLNSYISNQAEFFHHLGGNLFDHLIIILILPLLFTVGFLADRSRSMRKELEKMLKRETYVSGCLQAVFYPGIRQIDGYRVATRYRSVLDESELGGDCFDVFSLGCGKTALAITDVCGKGLRAAMVGAFAKSVIRTSLREYADLTEAAAKINSAISFEVSSDLFVTAFIAVLDELTGTIRYINAGHPGPLHVSGGGAVDILQAGSIPLGIFREQEFMEGEIALAPGDCLVLYTDGLYEFSDGEEACPETIAREVRDLLPADADTLAKELLGSAERHTGGMLRDDVAILALSRTPAASTRVLSTPPEETRTGRQVVFSG